MPAKTSQFRSWDDYFIPGTTVLRNKLVTAAEPYGTRDAEKLRRYEERAALLRMTELNKTPIVGKFDYDHFKATHKALFQDVYEWAGQERIGPDRPMTKSGPDVVHFAPGDPNAPFVNYGYYPGVGDQIREAAEKQFRKLAADDLLRGRDREKFVTGLADHWGEVNTIHSAREGNTRTQFVFFSELSRQAGYELDIAQFSENAPLRTEFVQARFYNQATAKTDRLEAVLDKALTEIELPPRSLPDRPLTAMERLARRRSRTHSQDEFEM
ncbi:cell filamentation protein Fic [Rhodococcus sp. SRB_17]|nr:cell filamentation protein Fic [Rhodococcus sp. SRB_17]